MGCDCLLAICEPAQVDAWQSCSCSFLAKSCRHTLSRQMNEWGRRRSASRLRRRRGGSRRSRRPADGAADQSIRNPVKPPQGGQNNPWSLHSLLPLLQTSQGRPQGGNGVLPYILLLFITRYAGSLTAGRTELLNSLDFSFSLRV